VSHGERIRSPTQVARAEKKATLTEMKKTYTCVMRGYAGGGGGIGHLPNEV
jgi:hypothetical protein